jgi:hypothetical protein
MTVKNSLQTSNMNNTADTQNMLIKECKYYSFGAAAASIGGILSGKPTVCSNLDFSRGNLKSRPHVSDYFGVK